MADDHGIYDIEIEKYAIAAALKYPEIIGEVSGLFGTTSPFYFPANAQIFDVIKSLDSENITPDPVLVANRVQKLNITLPNGIKCYDYLNSLNLISFSKESGVNYFRQLGVLVGRRKVYEQHKKAAIFAKKTTESSLGKIIAHTHELTNEQINLFLEDNEPRNLFEKAREVISDKVNNPGVQIGFQCGHKELDELYGGFRPKGLYCFGARAGESKSTLLLDLAHRICNIYNKDKNLKTLVLDTENEEDDTIIRAFANLTGVKYSDIEDGTFAANPNLRKKVFDTIEKGEKEYRIDFLKVGNMPAEELVGVIKRWYYKNHKNGESSVIIYDYLKLPEINENEGKEYVLMGKLADTFKKLAEQLNSVFLTAIQLNRSGDSRGKKSGTFNVNSSAVSISDRVIWYSSFLALFQKKTLDEISMDGVEWGTHKLTVLKARHQGKKAPGHFDFVQRTIDGKKEWCDNYLSFKVDNFSVTELGSVQTMIAQGKNKVNIETNSFEEEPAF